MNEQAKIKGTTPSSIEASITLETHFHVIQQLGRNIGENGNQSFPLPPVKASKVTYLFALQS